MISSAILITVILSLVLISVIHKWKRKDHPPGPFPWPFIGNQLLLRNLARELGGQHFAFSELVKRYRSDVITLRVGTSNIIVVSGNKAVQEVLNSEDYDGRPWNEFIKLRNMGLKKGITMNDGPEWKDVRAWMVRTLRSVGFGQRRMLELIKDELILVLENFKDGRVLCLNPVIAPAVINVVWTLATGKRLGEGSKLKYFINLMERRASAFDMSGGILSMYPWIRYIAPESSGYNLLVTLNNELKCLLMEAIDEHAKHYVPGNESDLIDMFLREMHARKDTDTVFTKDQLMMILLDLFIAGLITTVTTLDFLFVNMTVHQDAQQKLHEEIDSVIGSDRLPDLADRPKLPYTEAVLTESQRMWTVVPIIGPRRVLRDTNLNNYKIPKNAAVLIDIHSANMNADLYPNPEEFKPERFVKNGVYESDDNLILFGKGRRRCPGETLARSALFLLFAGIMQNFKLLPVPGKGPYKVEAVPGLTIAPKPYEVLLICWHS